MAMSYSDFWGWSVGTISCWRQRQGIGWAANGPTNLVEKVSVDHCRVDVAVTHQLLDSADVVAEKMKCLDWDRWHWENYTDPDRGRGFLLRVWNGRSLEKWVRRTLPAVDVVHTWTALVHAPKPAAEPGGA